MAKKYPKGTVTLTPKKKDGRPSVIMTPKTYMKGNPMRKKLA